jgi:homoserine kinase
MMRIWVPATSGNLGPGLDTLALAMNWWNGFEFAQGVSTDTVNIDGEAAADLDDRAGQTVLAAADGVYAAARAGARPPWRVHITANIPVAKGLGSSATAIVAGALAANHMLGQPLPIHRLVRLAATLDGHPDNVAAALLGGFVLTYRDRRDQVGAAVLPLGAEVRVVLAIPEMSLPTRKAREALPRAVPLDDAVANLGFSGLMVAGLTLGRLDCLADACQDRLHQPYRAHLLPGLGTAVRVALEAGAYAAMLSGAGSAVMALTAPARAEQVRSRIAAAWSAMQLNSDVRVLDISRRGAVVVQNATSADGDRL